MLEKTSADVINNLDKWREEVGYSIVKATLTLAKKEIDYMAFCACHQKTRTQQDDCGNCPLREFINNKPEGISLKCKDSFFNEWKDLPYEEI